MRRRATHRAAVPAWARHDRVSVNHGRLEVVRDLLDFDHDAVAADTNFGIDLAIFIRGYAATLSRAVTAEVTSDGAAAPPGIDPVSVGSVAPSPRPETQAAARSSSNSSGFGFHPPGKAVSMKRVVALPSGEQRMTKRVTQEGLRGRKPEQSEVGQSGDQSREGGAAVGSVRDRLGEQRIIVKADAGAGGSRRSRIAGRAAHRPGTVRRSPAETRGRRVPP